MLNLNYLKRLGLRGGRLVWRVLMILVPVIGYSFWQAMKEMMLSQKELRDEHQERGEFEDGTPYLENTTHPMWEYYWGDGR